ncbi:MAG: sugar phosphate isomerase/epimerase family protein [Verrucomicrobiota bacterium]
MKKSICSCSFYGNWSIEEKFKLAKEAGFEGFEIDLSEDGPVNLKSSDADLKAFRQTAAKHGLDLGSLTTFLYWGANGCSEDPKIREKAAGILKRQIEVAAGIGADSILVVPGSVGVDFIPGCEVVRYDVAYERAQKLIQEAIPLAEKHGVTICVENVWNKFLLSPLEMKSFVDSFGSDRVGAYFDVANVLVSGYPEHWIEILGSRIKRVHFKDYRRNVGSVDGFCDLLSGDVNWPAVVGSLRKIGYKSYVSAEMIPPVPFYKHCPEVLIHNTGKALDAILKL